MILKNKNILILSPTPFYPADAGNRVRILSIIKSLQEFGANIDFAHYPVEWWWGKLPLMDIENMRKEVREFFLIPTSVQLHKNAKGDYHTIDEWWDDSIEAYLKWIFKNREYDYFIVNYTYLSKSFEYCPDTTLKILDTHDKFSGRKELLESLGLKPEFFYTTLEEEKKGISRADIIWAIKDEERNYFEMITAKEILTVPFLDNRKNINGKINKINLNDDNILKIGILGAKNGLNIRNTADFLDVAIEIFKNNLAPIEIILAGSFCEELQAYSKFSWITFLGRINKVDDFYKIVDLVLVPLKKSTGLKIKACEAIAHGCPVIGFEDALEGTFLNHKFSKIKEHKELAEACVDISFNRSILNSLQEASASALHELKQVYDISLKNTFTKSKIKNFIIISSAETLSSRNLNNHLFTQFTNFISNMGSIFVYVDNMDSVNPDMALEWRQNVNSKVSFITNNNNNNNLLSSYGFEVINEDISEVIIGFDIETIFYDISCNLEIKLISNNIKNLIIIDTLANNLKRPIEITVLNSLRVCYFNCQYDLNINSNEIIINASHFRWLPERYQVKKDPGQIDLLIEMDSLLAAECFIQKAMKAYAIKLNWRIIIIDKLGCKINSLTSKHSIIELSEILNDYKFIASGAALLIFDSTTQLSSIYSEIINRNSIKCIDLRYGVSVDKLISVFLPENQLNLADNKYDNDSGWSALWNFIND